MRTSFLVLNDKESSSNGEEFSDGPEASDSKPLTDNVSFKIVHCNDDEFEIFQFSLDEFGTPAGLDSGTGQSARNRQTQAVGQLAPTPTVSRKSTRKTKQAN